MKSLRNILLVEDSPDDAQLILLQLEHEGLDIEYRRVDTEAAFIAALDPPPDLILSDFAMPQFNGLRALRIIRERAMDVPFLLVSGTIGEEVAVEAMKQGADDYLMKDRLARLGPAIQSALNKKRLKDEKARADIAVRHSEARFRSLIENSSDEVSIISADGSLLYESPSSNPTLGYQPGEFLGKSLFELVHPNDLELVQSQFAQLIRDPHRRPRDRFRLLHRNGTWRWVEAVGTNLLHEPAVGGIVVNYHDVTDSVEAEEQIRYQALLLENVSDAVVSTDVGGIIKSLNKAAESTFGFTATEAIGQLSVNLFKTEYISCSREEAIAQLRRIGNWHGEVRVFRKDGGTVDVISSVSTIKDSHGNALGYVSLNHDITDRKRAEEALRNSEEQYRSLFEDSPVSLWVEDFSEVKRRLDALKTSGVKDIQEYLQAHPDFAMECAKLIQVLDVNNTSTKLYHAKHKSELLGSLLHVFPALSPKEIKYELSQLANGQFNFEREESSHTLTGETIYINTRWSVAPGYEDSLAKVIVSTTDITERKQAEAKLQASESRYRLATRATNDVIWEWDAQTNQLTWTENAQAVFGYSPDEIGPDATWWDTRIHPDDRPRILSRLDEVVKGSEMFWQDEYRFLLKAGSYATISDHGYIERDSTGRAMRLIGAMSDITKRKQSEERIQRQLQQLNAFRAIDIAISSTFDLKPSLAVLLSKVVSQLKVSAAAVLLFNQPTFTLEYVAGNGFTSPAIQQTRLKMGEGLPGRAALERHAVHVPNLAQTGEQLVRTQLLADEAFVAYYAMPLIAKGELKGVLEIFHRTQIHPDSEWLEFLEALTGQAAIAIDNAQLFERLQRSKTELEHRVAERTAELHRMNIELESASRAKDEFLASMSHELRTPLNSIIGLSESLLEQRRGALNETQEKSLQTIEASGRHLLDLITDILDLSKIQAGKFEFRPQLVLVEDLCRSSLAFINAQAIKKSIKVTYENETSIASITADPRRLKQILINLLSNAVKFTHENGQVTLQVQANPEQARIEFSVIDTGIGIAPDDLGRLFQPFVQLDSTLNRQFEGTGLGLTLVQKLSDMHGGSVEVESEPGKGSRFTIYLPLEQETTWQSTGPEQDTDLQLEKDIPSLEELPARTTILIAEDNAANILTVGDYLESHGYEIVIAHDGAEAIEKAETMNPDIILMDIQMPVMNGLEAMMHLRTNSRFASTPIIALTALAMPGDRERCLKAGATEYMSKPVSLRALANTIAKLLDHSN